LPPTRLTSSLRLHLPRSVRAEGRAQGLAEGPVDAAAPPAPDARRAAEAALAAEYRWFVRADPGAPAPAAAELRRRLDAVGRELTAASVGEHARLAGAEAAAAAGERAPAFAPDALAALGLSLAAAAAAEAATAAAPRANITPVRPAALRRKPGGATPAGSGAEVLLQAFNWESWRNGDFYAYLESQAGAIADMGFTAVWLPPPTASVSPQGYMPTDLYDLNSKYGTEAELRSCLAALKAAGLKTLADAVLNHRCAARQDESGAWNLFGGRLDWDQHAIVGDDPNVSSLSCQSKQKTS
jgi:hypothetical protein